MCNRKSLGGAGQQCGHAKCSGCGDGEALVKARSHDVLNLRNDLVGHYVS